VVVVVGVAELAAQEDDGVVEQGAAVGIGRCSSPTVWKLDSLS